MKHQLRGYADDRSVYLDNKRLFPDRSLKVINHSPDGFNWGYGGSGPSQLALAVVLELTGRTDHYQRFKEEVIAGLPGGANFDIEFDLSWQHQ